MLDHPDGMLLRRAGHDDGRGTAAAVRASLGHLARWMAWADERACDTGVQRTRLLECERLWDEGTSFEYVLVPLADETNVRGSLGMMTRLGPGTIELGYWVHVDDEGKGYVRASVVALTNAALELELVEAVKICLEPANTRSQAIPRTLGFTCDGMMTDHPLGCSECWTRTTPTQLA